MKTTKFALIFGVLSLLAPVLLGLVACTSGSTTTSPSGTSASAGTSGSGAGSSASSAPIKIGVLVGITGYLTKYDTPIEKGIRMAADELNKQGGVLGRKIEVLSEDMRGEPTAAVTGATKLIDSDKVDFLLTGTSSGGTGAIAPVMAKSEKVTIVNSAMAPDMDKAAFKWIFTAVVPAQFEMEPDLQYMQKNKITKAGILRDTTPYSLLVKGSFDALTSKYGVTVVSDETYDPTATDISAQLIRMRTVGAGAIVQIGAGPVTGLALNTMVTLGMNIPLIGSQGTIPAEIVKIAGDNSKKLVFPAQRPMVWDTLPASDPYRDSTANFAKPWVAANPDQDPAFGGRGYDSMMMLAKAIEKAKSTKNSDVRDALETLQYKGIATTYSFSAQKHEGVTDSPFIMSQIVGTKPQVMTGN